MRGGLDDALSKLARRDELRRRAAGEATGTPPAVTELVEAIAAVVARNPQLAVTVGVEGAGDPVLLQFGFADGVVQVSADNTLAARAAEQGPRHADFEIEVEDAPEFPAEPPRASHDDQDRFGPTDFAYEYDEPPTAERPFVAPVPEAYAPPSSGAPYSRPPGESSRDNLVHHRNQTNGSAPASPPPHPFAPTPPPPVPPQPPEAYAAEPHPYAPTSSPGYADQAHSSAAEFVPGFTAQHAEPQHHDAPYPEPPYFAEQPAFADQPTFGEQQKQQPGYLEPLAKPIPLKVERPEETEMAARRLAALLRDDPTLLDNPPS